MSNIKTLYNQAELAFAAYADLDQGPLDEGQRAKLENSDFTQKQAEEFAARYTEVITQFNDTDTSFSATVFKDTSGNLTLAIRGTAELIGSPNDLLPTDKDIFLHGAGYDQIVANTHCGKSV